MNTKPISSIKEENNDGTYIIKEVFEKTTFQRGFLSRIKKYNSDKIWLGGETFKDKEFSELNYTKFYTYNPDGSYQRKIIYEEPDNDGNMSCVEEFDKKYKLLSTKYFKDKEIDK